MSLLILKKRIDTIKVSDYVNQLNDRQKANFGEFFDICEESDIDETSEFYLPLLKFLSGNELNEVERGKALICLTNFNKALPNLHNLNARSRDFYVPFEVVKLLIEDYFNIKEIALENMLKMYLKYNKEFDGYKFRGSNLYFFKDDYLNNTIKLTKQILGNEAEEFLKQTVQNLTQDNIQEQIATNYDKTNIDTMIESISKGLDSFEKTVSQKEGFLGQLFNPVFKCFMTQNDMTKH